MTNGRIDVAQADAIISGDREQIDRVVATGVLELRATVVCFAGCGLPVRRSTFGVFPRDPLRCYPQHRNTGVVLEAATWEPT